MKLKYLGTAAAEGVPAIFCECENCKERPADYLVMILNDIDKKLTENGIDTKIAFPIYHDLLWGPIKEKFHNPSRFIYEFAPITRTYTHSYDEIDTGKNRSIPPYIKKCIALL